MHFANPPKAAQKKAKKSPAVQADTAAQADTAPQGESTQPDTAQPEANS